MRRLLLVPVVVALTVSVLQADIRRSQTPAAAPQSAEGFPAAGGAPIVKLLSPGAEPRKALRYSAAAGTTTRTEITTEMGMTMQMMGQSMPMPMPTMKMVTDLTITAVAANGDMTFSSGMSSMKVESADPQVAAALAGASTDVSGVKSTGTMTNRGVTNQQMDLSKITDPQLKQAMEQAGLSLQSMSFPLPAENVGIGARWEVKQRVAASGMEMLTTQTVELVAIEGTKITLKIGTTQSAPPQTLKNPMLPPEAEMTLTKMTGTGTGTTVLDLATFSNQGESTMSMAMDMQIKMMGMEQATSSTMDMKIKMTPVK